MSKKNKNSGRKIHDGARVRLIDDFVTGDKRHFSAGTEGRKESDSGRYLYRVRFDKIPGGNVLYVLRKLVEEIETSV